MEPEGHEGQRFEVPRLLHLDASHSFMRVSVVCEVLDHGHAGQEEDHE
jgi:hypothetical protein